MLFVSPWHGEKQPWGCATNYTHAFFVILHTLLMLIYCTYTYIAAKITVLRTCCTVGNHFPYIKLNIYHLARISG
jgi:hypothetical protein